jgi:hypothetical protein
MPLERHAPRDSARLFQIGAVRAHAERFDVDDRPPVEVCHALIRAGQRDARLDAFFEACGARRVIAAERHAPDADAAAVDVAARLQVIDDCLHGLFVFRADWQIEFRLTLARPIEGERREPAPEEAVLVVVHLLLRRVESHAHDDDRGLRDSSRLAQVAIERRSLVGNRDALARRIDEQ